MGHVVESPVVVKLEALGTCKPDPREWHFIQEWISIVVHEDPVAGVARAAEKLGQEAASVKKVAGRPGALDAPVAEYMTTDPVVVRENETVAVALHKMADGGFRHVPMGTAQGYRVVTASDALQWVVERYIELGA